MGVANHTHLTKDQTIRNSDQRPIHRSAWRDLNTNSAPFFSSSVRNSWPFFVSNWQDVKFSPPEKNGGWEGDREQILFWSGFQNPPDILRNIPSSQVWKAS